MRQGFLLEVDVRKALEQGEGDVSHVFELVSAMMRDDDGGCG